MSNSIVEILLEEVLSGDSLKAMKKVTGADSKETSSVVMTALPLLLQGLSNTSSSKDNNTVEKLLDTYSSSKKLNIAETIEKSDENEGIDLLSAILGKSSAKVEKSVSESTGVDKDKVVKILASIVPIVLTFISYQNKKNKKSAKKSNDTSEQLTDLLGDLIGVATKKSNSSDLVSTLISALLK